MLFKSITISFLLVFVTGSILAHEIDDVFVTRLETSDALAEANQLTEFAGASFIYTAIGWNFTDIDKSIIGLNLDQVESVDDFPFNASLRDYIRLLPEHTFTTTEVLDDRSLAIELAQRIPEPDLKIIPCIINSTSPDDLVATRLSCIARDSYSYFVAGALEKVACKVNNETQKCRPDGWNIFSTTVAFDKNGHLVAKYRKFHLIDEPALDAAPFPEAVTFTTDGNVTFGLLSGHDLMFEEPAKKLMDNGVEYFLMNGAWKNMMPFQFSLSVQKGWANWATGKSNASLVASNYLRGEMGYTGGGHYFLRDGFSTAVMAQGSGGYIMDELLVRPKLSKTASKATITEVWSESQDLSNWTSVAVPFSNQDATVEVCHGEEFCCTLFYRMNRIVNSDYHFQLLAFSGNRTDSAGNILYPEQTCGLAACSGADKMTCGANKNETLFTADVSFPKLSLSGIFASDQVMPVSMEGGIGNYFTLGATYQIEKLDDGRFNVTHTCTKLNALANSFGLSSLDYRLPEKSGANIKHYFSTVALVLTAGIVNYLN